jgi:cytochrome c553
VIDGWNAPPLSETNPSPVPWTQDELFTYLRTGSSPLHGATGATMTPVIREGLALPVVPDSDVRAIAVYFSDIDHGGARAQSTEATTRAAIASSSLGSAQEYDPDADLYAAACIACHYNAGPVPLSARPELALNSALTLPEPTNFIQVVLKGSGNSEGAPGLVMPAYASSLTDGDIARLAAYLRRTRTKYPPWRALEEKVSAIRRESAASQ